MEEKLIENIKKHREIKDSSLKVYLANVRKLNGGKTITNLKFLRKTETTLNKIADLKIPTQRNYLTSILVILTAQPKFKATCEKYKEALRTLNDTYNEHINSHQKTEKEDKNWCNLKHLRKTVLNHYKREITERLLNDKNTLTSKEFDLYQKYIISALYLLLPPVRLDYANMDIVTARDDMTDKDKNYLLNISRNTKYFYINEHKTSKTHGTLEIKIPKELNTILNNWLKINTSEYLLVNKSGSKMTANVLSKAITKAFLPSGKNISLNMLRKIYISEHIDLDIIKKRKELADAMGHSVDTQTTYIKQ